MGLSVPALTYRTQGLRPCGIWSDRTLLSHPVLRTSVGLRIRIFGGSQAASFLMAPRTFIARSGGSSVMPCAVRACSAHCSRISCSVSPFAMKSQSTPTSLQLIVFAILTPHKNWARSLAPVRSGDKPGLKRRFYEPWRHDSNRALPQDHLGNVPYVFNSETCSRLFNLGDENSVRRNLDILQVDRSCRRFRGGQKNLGSRCLGSLRRKVKL
jgi:hypothetical protein